MGTITDVYSRTGALLRCPCCGSSHITRGIEQFPGRVGGMAVLYPAKVHRCVDCHFTEPAE